MVVFRFLSAEAICARLAEKARDITADLAHRFQPCINVLQTQTWSDNLNVDCNKQWIRRYSYKKREDEID